MDIAIIVIACILAAGLISLFVTVRVLWYKSYKKAPALAVRSKQSVVEWFKNHLPSKRRLIQIYAALLYNANIKGFVSGYIYESKTTKYLCVPGLNCYSCPGAVGACPLGALQNALAESTIRAPYYMLGILALLGITFARTICGFLCPVGLGQDLLYKIRTPKLKKSRTTRVLSYLKYVILAIFVIAIPVIYALEGGKVPGFCKYICPAGVFGGALPLLSNPNRESLFTSLGPLFTWKFCLMVAIIAAAIFIYRFFCRFFCPLGAIYGFFNRFAFLGIKTEKERCTDCGLCVSHCKMDVKRVGDHECINCGECISVCPTKAIGWRGAKLFVHANAVSEPSEEKPLSVCKSVSESASVKSVEESATTVLNESVTATEEGGEQQEKKTPIPVKRKKTRAKFWLELSAWCAALFVFVGATVYYNAIDVKTYVPPVAGYKVGDVAPNFTVSLYGSEEKFTLYEKRGRVTIVNFWATWCGGCVEELPYFNELSQKRTEWNVVAIHGDDRGGTTAKDWIARKYPDWTLAFAQDEIKNNVCLTFAAFGGTQDWPLTVIIDEEGKVIYNSSYGFKSCEDLESTVLRALEER